MNIKEQDILKLKEDALEIRDKVISAKSTYESVLKNIEDYKEELKQLGVDGDADQKINEMKEEIESIYNKSKILIDEWKEKMV